MRLLRSLCFSVLSVLALVASPGQAQVGPRALPALLTTPRLQRPEALSFALAGALGYGAREALTKSDALHHTTLATLGASVLAPWGLGAELRVDGRFEKHTAKGDAGSGWVGEARAYLRYSHAVGTQLELGAELGAFVPGSRAPSLRFGATALEGSLIVDARLREVWSLIVAPGFRFDRSGRAVDHPERLQTGDFVTLGLSDSHAVLLRAGVERRLARGQLFAECNWEAHVGKRAPRLSSSPLFLALGGRAALDRAQTLALTVSARALLSQRADVNQAGPLVPHPPRAELWLGLRYELGKKPAAPEVDLREAPKASAPEPAVIAAPVTHGPLRVRLVDPAHTPIAGASVHLDGALSSLVATDASGEARFEQVAFGRHSLQATANGFRAAELTLEHDASDTTRELILNPSPASGQLRLLVRDHRSGEPLPAEIEVQLDGDGSAAPSVQRPNADGRLLLDLPPGRYRVKVALKGYRKQIKHVEIEDKSVTILDVGMHARSAR